MRTSIPGFRHSRRNFLGKGGLGLAALIACHRASNLGAAVVPNPVLPDLEKQLLSPVRIASLELLRRDKNYFVRATSSDGVTGIAMTNERIEYLQAMLLQKVMPVFKGKDARQIESLVAEVYTAQSNYKLAGLALWNPVGWVEFAVFDLLGKTAKKSIGELLGGVRRREIPVYMSSMRRDTTPAQEIEWVGKRVAETGARAVKLKIGGRMSNDADAAPGRTEKLVALARKTWGEQITLYVDANGSYSAPKAIAVGKMLEEHQVAFFEEPCPWEDFESTKRVADGLQLKVAGGEQDTSLDKFAWYIRRQGLDIVQPDVNYNGGFIRTLQVAQLAAGAGMPVAPHAPQAGFATAYLAHFISVIPNAGPFHEYNAAPRKIASWHTPSFEVKNGVVQVPTGPGLGIAIDPDYLKGAEIIKAE
jgi:L-alanine-DL-glutamate epimerase-like enolase superfamily enzyme